MLLAQTQPGLWSGEDISWSKIRWMPFEALWHRPAAQAAGELLGAFVTFGTLAVTLAFLLGRARVTTAWLKIGIAVTLLAAVVEGLQVPSAVRTADITTPVVALIAVIAAAQAHSIFRAAGISHPVTGVETANA